MRLRAAFASPQSKREYVRYLFATIADRYDFITVVLSYGQDRRWKRRLVALAAPPPGARALDVACGTGDMALELARRVGPGGEVVGCDFSEGMLELARAKAADAGAQAGASLAPLRFEWGNALELPYRDDEFAAATVGFGVRNFSDLERGLRELVRVVRPGGRVVILEMTTPTKPPLSTFFRIWFDRVVPLLGRVAGDGDAFTYLPRSVQRFPGPHDLAATMERCGMRGIRYVLTAGGIIAIHAGEVA